MEFMGAPLKGDLRQWEVQQRRTAGYIALGAAAALVALAILTWLVAGDVAWLYWTLVVLLVVVLGFIVALMAMSPPTQAAAPPPAYAEPAPAPAAPTMASAPQPAPAAPQPKIITLRCGDCGTVFDIPDNGERPLYHTCPGCGAEGVLQAPAPAAPPPAPAPPAPAAPAPSPLPAPRRLKLRCGGCKEVFVIEDSGERPLRRPCPYCGRMGEIR